MMPIKKHVIRHKKVCFLNVKNYQENKIIPIKRFKKYIVAIKLFLNSKMCYSFRLEKMQEVNF